MEYNTIFDKFELEFRGKPIMVRAPARINIIGEHTDYNDGWVLPAAIDKALYFALGKSKNSNNHFIASNLGEEAIFSFSEIQLSKEAIWLDYIQAVFQLLLEKGFPVKATNGILGGNIPLGAGLSSSAALCCGLIYGLSKLHSFFLPREEIAFISQEAEHRIGLNCGLMDQYAVLFGQQKNALLLDCNSLDYQQISIDLDDYSLVLINSNIKHALAAGSEFNERRASCERVVSFVKKKYPAVQTLRQVTANMLDEHKDICNPIDMQRATYVIKENQRVLDVVKALKKGDLATVGEILYIAHERMRTEYEVTVSEIDLLVDLAKAQPTILGARMVGGGFGGCTINLIKTKGKESVLSKILVDYKNQTQIQAEVIDVVIGNGVELIS